MSLVENMDGTQCEKVHLLYMERMGAFVNHFLVYHFDIVLLILASSCCLARLLCYLAQGCS